MPAAAPVRITTTPPDPTKGITVYATPLGDGTLSMTETVRFSTPQIHLRLSPPRIADAGAAFTGLVPTVSQIELTVDGTDMLITTRTLTSSLVVALAQPGAKRVDVRYLLDNVVARSASRTSTSSAIVAPLIDGSEDELNVSYVIGAQINSYGCPQLTTATARADCSALANTVSGVGLISGLPSGISLLVIGLPAGSVTPSPPSPSPVPPKPSSTPAPTPSSSTTAAPTPRSDPTTSTVPAPPPNPPTATPTDTTTTPAPAPSPPPAVPTPTPSTPTVTATSVPAPGGTPTGAGPTTPAVTGAANPAATGAVSPAAVLAAATAGP